MKLFLRAKLQRKNEKREKKETKTKKTIKNRDVYLNAKD